MSTKTFFLQVLASDKIFYKGQCQKLIIPLADGEKAVLPHHGEKCFPRLRDLKIRFICPVIHPYIGISVIGGRLSSAHFKLFIQIKAQGLGPAYHLIYRIFRCGPRTFHNPGNGLGIIKLSVGFKYFLIFYIVKNIINIGFELAGEVRRVLIGFMLNAK